ncbi:MAG: glycoside hydrolase family 57, partial [Hungatella sp.]
GRFNVREALEALYRANDRVAGAMEELGIAGLRSLYSPDIMSSQLGLIEERLMEMRYFEDE